MCATVAASAVLLANGLEKLIRRDLVAFVSAGAETCPSDPMSWSLVRSPTCPICGVGTAGTTSRARPTIADALPTMGRESTDSMPNGPDSLAGFGFEEGLAALSGLMRLQGGDTDTEDGGVSRAAREPEDDEESDCGVGCS